MSVFKYVMVSVMIHAGLIYSASGTWVSKPIYFIEQGISSVEVSLVDPVVDKVLKDNEVNVDDKEVADEVVMKSVETEKVVNSVSTQQGSLVESKPDYLKNPSPIYPELARQKGEQGFVLLAAQVDEKGYVITIRIKQSSGFSLLDQAAVKSVKRWRFVPAKLGAIPVASTVDVPIRFKLE